METTEKIVESYCRCVKNLFTISNIKVNNDEIDILAIDTTNKESIKKYHIEVSVSISSGFSRLTEEDFDWEKYKDRSTKAAQRRTIGFFLEKKFDKKAITEKLSKYGFLEGNYTRVIVSWGWTDGARSVAERHKIELWNFRDILAELFDKIRSDKTYFKDDALRTLQLYALANQKKDDHL